MSKASEVGIQKKRARRIFLGGAGMAFVVAIIGFIVLDKAMVPLSSDGFCVSCHEMEAVHQSWQQSAHHNNPSGVKVTCVECHLPPRGNYTSHLQAKAVVGIKDAWVHTFGEYNQAESRKHVLETLPDEWCINCHNNLLAMPSSRPVGIVHKSSLECGRSGGYGCITCHDALHGAKAPEPEPREYEEIENSYCYVCHINFQQEPFVKFHESGGVGCVKCHGESDPHADDEDHVLPPDIMYDKADVNKSCMTAECHPKAKMEKEIGHRPFFAKTDTDRKYCTDCHGMHNIPERHRKWDKDTRKLIFRDGYTTG